MSLAISDKDGIRTILLARPEKKNALDLDTLAGLQQTLAEARNDADVKVIVLGAQGDVFCAGGDVQVMKEAAGDAQATLDRLRGGLNNVVTAIHEHPKPIIGMVQGNAYGAGAILAFQCDVTFAADDAMFAFSFRHVGLIPDTGGTWLLPRRLGLQRAKQLVWTGAPFSAADAAKWDLVLESVPKAQLAGKVDQFARALADGPLETAGLAKMAMHRNFEENLEAALEREARLQAHAFLGSEHAEGRDAFFARRRPDWSRS